MVTEIKEYFQKVGDAIFDCSALSTTYEEAEKYNGTDLINARTIEKYIALIEDAIIQNGRHTGIAIAELLPEISALMGEFKPYSPQIDFAEVAGEKDAYVYLARANKNFESFVNLLKEKCNAHNIPLPKLSEELEYIPEPQQIVLPEELSTDEAMGVFTKAIESGVICIDDSGYHWEGTDPQLALFAEVMHEKLRLTNKWKSFEELFNKKNLAQTRYNSVEKVGKVRGDERIYRLFE